MDKYKNDKRVTHKMQYYEQCHLCKALTFEFESTKELNVIGTTITFDLQKTLPTPVLTTGVCYYKRQLWTYNLGIHSMVDDQAFMYLWNEFIALRGPDEIASAFQHYATT